MSVVQPFLEAIAILDQSELAVRDAIERGLMNDVGPLKGKYTVAQRAADHVVKQVAVIRTKATREAFRHIRDTAGAPEGILGHPLTAWASAIARYELTKIDNVIRTGLKRGYDGAQIAAMAIGTVRNNGRDGMTETSRQQIMNLARTHQKELKP